MDQLDEEAKCPKDRLGNTPLHEAVLFGHVETVKWIFQACPQSTSVLNCNGKMPIDVAKTNPYGHPYAAEIVQILSQFISVLPFAR